MVAYRMAQRANRTHPLLDVQPAAGHQPEGFGEYRQDALAYRARLPRIEARVRLIALRRPWLARFSSPCDAMRGRLRLSHCAAIEARLQKKRCSITNACLTQRLLASRQPDERSATSPTPSRRFAISWPRHSRSACPGVPAVISYGCKFDTVQVDTYASHPDCPLACCASSPPARKELLPQWFFATGDTHGTGFSAR